MRSFTVTLRTVYIRTFECKVSIRLAYQRPELNTQGNYDLNQLLPEWIHVLRYTLVAALKHFASGPWTILVQISRALLGLALRI